MSGTNDEIKGHFEKAFATTFAGFEIARMPVIAFDEVPRNFKAKDQAGKVYHFFYVLNPIAQRLTIKCRAINKRYIHYYGTKSQLSRTNKPTPKNEALQNLAHAKALLAKKQNR